MRHGSDNSTRYLLDGTARPHPPTPTLGNLRASIELCDCTRTEDHRPQLAELRNSSLPLSGMTTRPKEVHSEDCPENGCNCPHAELLLGGRVL